MKQLLPLICAVCLPFTATSAMAKTKYVATEEINNTMQSFTKALGVQCNYCHVADRSATLKDYKWANDEEFSSLRHKRIAQAMIGMQIEVNKESNVKFDCMKCHQGQKP